MDTNKLWGELLERKLFTEDELQLVTNMAGYSVDTLNDAIYARYGYHSLDQMKEG